MSYNDDPGRNHNRGIIQHLPSSNDPTVPETTENKSPEVIEMQPPPQKKRANRK